MWTNILLSKLHYVSAITHISMGARWRVPKNGWVRKQVKTDRRNESTRMQSTSRFQNIQKCPGDTRALTGELIRTAVDRQCMLGHR